MAERDFFGAEANFDHVGLVVHSIAESACPTREIFTDDIQKVRVAFLNAHGARIELIEPLNETSPLWQSLKEGRKLVHLAYRVPNLEQAMQRGRKGGFHCIMRPVPATAFQKKKIAWVFHKKLGLFELIEE